MSKKWKDLSSEEKTRQRKYIKATQDRYAADGKCRCGRERVNGRSKCARCRENHLASERKRKFGVDRERHEGMLEEQNHKCAICGVGVDKSSHIDHCHKSGVVRGILCRSCNTFLGLLEKFRDTNLLTSAESYLKKTPPSSPARAR